MHDERKRKANCKISCGCSSAHQISTIPDAEREASEVLHSLLPVERIERKGEIETVSKIENCYDDFDYLDDEALSRRRARDESNVVNENFNFVGLSIRFTSDFH